MTYRLYLFHTGRGLVWSLSIFTQKDIDAAKEFIKNYEKEENCTVIRAILGPTDLTKLEPDEELRLPNKYAEPVSGGSRR
jgi:hypothetical protein